MKKNNLNQEKAISFKDGPCLVISGPGSGKTYVITNRICKLIKEHKVKPENILVITFTRSSADEMRIRFKKLIKERNLILDSEPVFGTFHSVFYEILRCEFGYKANSLITKDESLNYVSEILGKSSLYGSVSTKAMLKNIEEYKLAKEREEEYIPDELNIGDFKRLYNVYEKLLYDNRKLDFSDMIYKCFELLSVNKTALSKYQNLYKYILIDEFQDINKSQYRLVKLICKSKNLFVVGDDDQSIYSFRGSMPKVMKDFMNDYRNATKIYLDTNYRSKANIVKFSKRLIDHNRVRFKKSLNADDNDVGNIEIKKFTDSRDEDKYIIDEIKEYIKEGYALRDIAILYRINLLSHSIMQDLKRHNISYKIKEDTEEQKSNEVNESTDSDAINLMTFHLSKGLEFKVVFIIDANDGIVPHKKSIKNFELETERRLFYVAMTRAKSNLHILFTTRRFGKNYIASRFILEAIGGTNGKER